MPSSSLLSAAQALAVRLDRQAPDSAGVNWLSVPFARFGGYFRRHRERLVDISLTRPILFIVVGGSKQISTGTTTLHHRPGDMAILPVGVPLTVLNLPSDAGPYRSVMVEFTDTVRDRCRLLLDGTPPIPPAPSLTLPPDLAQGPALQQAMAHLLAGIGTVDPALMEHRLLEVLLILCRGGYAGHLLPAPAHSLSARLRAMVRAAPEGDWSADTVARHLAVSVPTLHRRLRAEGTTLRAEVESVRLDHGHTLLVSRQVGTVTEAALRSGYTSPSRFASRFRHRFGANPSALSA